MTAVAFTDLKTVATALGKVSPTDTVGIPKTVRPDAPVGAERRFSQAMEKAASDKVVGVSATQLIDPAKVSTARAAAAAEANPDAQDRAGHALKPDSPASSQKKYAGGDAVLDGLQKLRGVFDQQERRMSSTMSRPMTDVNAMLAMQVDVINFTVLVDVTSKLTGQSTQALATLLKGQ